MAAAGGDTIVPTNWGGLILTAVIIAVVAAGTYFGMESMFGHQGGVEQTDELTVQEVFSASAKREVEAVEQARVLSRAELAASSSDDSDWDAAPADDMMDSGAQDDWDTDSDSGAEAVADDGDDWDSGNDDWDTASSDDWESASAEAADEMAADAEEAMEAAAEQAAEVEDAIIEDTMASAAETADAVAEDIAAATSDAMDAARNALTAPDGPVRQRPSAEALRDWWSEGSGDLAVRFAGTLDRGNRVSDGIAVMFSEPVSPSQAGQHMTLSNANGNAVNASWKTARNPNMLIVEGLSVGRYELNIDSALTSQSGTSLAKSIGGPVFVY